MSMMFAESVATILLSLLTALPSMLLGIASYVLSAAAIYVISRRRGLHKPWLAWIPVVNVWLLGSLSDQYQYVVKRKNTSRRKWLLVLNLMKPVLYAGTIGFGVSAFMSGHYYGIDWEDAVVALGFALPMAAAAVAAAVIRYIALYDVFKSLDPDNAVLFLVLSVLFGITEPFFLFFNRDKDSGMPPRREPVYEAPRPENWGDM